MKPNIFGVVGGSVVFSGYKSGIASISRGTTLSGGGGIFFAALVFIAVLTKIFATAVSETPNLY